VDTVTGDWASGIFRHLNHLVPEDARTVRFDGQRFFVAACGSITVPPGVSVPGERDRCVDCLAHDRGHYR
jgi:hypothetical protein